MASRFEAEKFTGKNDFGLWRMKMRAMLIQQGLAAALVVKDPKEKGKEVDDEKSRIKKAEIPAKAHRSVVLCLRDKVLREVAKEETAAGIMTKLEGLYMTKSLVNRLYMKQRLYSYKFSDERGITEQLEDFNKAVDDLENIDVTLEDEDKAIMLLNALPKSYDQLRDTMLYGSERSITLTEVQSALRAKELQKGIHKPPDAVAESLNIKKFKPKKQFKKKYDDAKGSNSGQKETRSCHWCKKPGHIKKDCYAWKRKQAAKGQTLDNSDCIEEVGTPEILNAMESTEVGSWIMDSGCSFHMCPKKEWFEEIKETRGSVLLGNNQVCSVEGIRCVRMKMHDDSVKVLSDVRYIPQIKRNLISLGMLERKGFSFTSTAGRMRVMKGSHTVMVAERVNNLYYLLASVVTGDVHAVLEGSMRLWHMRLRHPAEKGIKELIRNGILKGVQAHEMQDCEECVMAKAKKLPFQQGKHTSEFPLAYAHSDLLGPAQTTSIGGWRYYMSIIDDFSKKLWVYILKEKSEALQKFKEWHKQVENEKGCSLKYLRTNNGLEYLSHEFDMFCKEKGIRRHRTVPSNPQQNGVAEKMNRTILEWVRCMLLTSGMPKRFWAEAVDTAAKLINKCPYQV